MFEFHNSKREESANISLLDGAACVYPMKDFEFYNSNILVHKVFKSNWFFVFKSN